MHIHPPKERVESLRHLVKELSIITVGILIALSLESCVEKLHNRHNLNNAKANIIAECQLNQKNLKSMTAKIPNELAELIKVIRLCKSRLAKSEIESQKVDLNLEFTATTVSSGAWSAAGFSGAIGHMKFKEISQFANVYELQAVFATMQQRTLEKWVQLQQISILSSEAESKANALSVVELQDIKRNAVEAYSNTVALQSCASALIYEYEQIKESVAVKPPHA